MSAPKHDAAKLAPLADIMRDFVLGIAKAGATPDSIRAAPDEAWMLMAARVEERLREHGIAIVRTQ